MPFTVRRALPILGSAVLFLGLGGCMPQRIDHWVAQHYRKNSPNLIRKVDSAIVVTSALPDMGEAMSQTENINTHMLPLVFYWKFEYRHTCTLNPRPAISNFTTTVLANISPELKLKLKGRQLVLRVDQVPDVFTVDDKGHYVVLIIYPVGWRKYAVQPQLKDMVVSYRLVDAANEVLKNGTIVVPDKENVLDVGVFMSPRKQTKRHLEEYDASITVMAKKVAERLNNEL